MKRHQELSIREPESTNFGTATSFNKTNVQTLFDKLASAIDIHPFTVSTIWNMDETEVPKICKATKIVAAKSKRSIGSMTSAERGTNVTLVVAASVLAGVTPMFIVP